MRDAFLRIALTPTTLSHLPCIACGRFRCDFAIVVQDNGEAADPEAGVHRKCIPRVKAKRGAT